MPEEHDDALVKALAAHPQLVSLSLGDLIALGSAIIGTFVAARSGAAVPVNLRGIRFGGSIYDLTGGTLQKRPH